MVISNVIVKAPHFLERSHLMYLESIVALLEVNEGVVFDFLHAFDFAVHLEGLLEFLLGALLGQVSRVQHLHLDGRFLDYVLHTSYRRRAKWSVPGYPARSPRSNNDVVFRPRKPLKIKIYQQR